MREPFFEELKAVYSRLEKRLPKTQGNPCGDCRLCCTTAELNEHRVTSLELDYLESHVGQDKTQRFLEFLARRPDTVCPYYDRGCTVYEVRPYSCRAFGHFRREDTPLPQVCVFRGQEKIFGVKEHRRRLPESDELASLSRRYWAHRIPREQGEQTLYQAAGLDESLARALELLRDGRSDEAIELITQDSSTDPFSLYCKSLMLEEADRPDLSYQLIRAALPQAPHSADLWHRAGVALLALGQPDDASQAFRRSLQLHSAQPFLWGLLGLLCFQAQDLEEAARCFEAALELEPGHPVFSQRLHEVREKFNSL